MEKKCVVISRCPLLAALVLWCFRVLQNLSAGGSGDDGFIGAFALLSTSLLLSFITWHISKVQYVFPQTAVFRVEYTWCHFHLSRYHIWMPSSTHWNWLHNYRCVPFFSVVWSCREPLPPCQWYLSTGAQRFPDYTEGNVATVRKAKTFWLPLLPHHR